MIDFTFKICLFGDGGVGKTSLTERYLTGLFKEEIKLTIGTNFYQKKLHIKDKSVSLQIWDFGGERQFRKLFPRYVQGSQGAIFMYDLTRYSSLNNINEWMEALSEGFDKENQIPMIMVGGKADLVEQRVVGEEASKEMMDKHNFFEHIECSAKMGLNIEKIFYNLTLKILKNIDE